MRKLVIGLVGALSLAGLTACESKEDAAAEKKADQLESQAAATSNEAVETKLNQQADAIEQQAGNADGGLTTKNTPSTNAPTQ